MNVEIGTQAAQFPENEYISGIFVAVQIPDRKISEDYVDLIWNGRKFFLDRDLIHQSLIFDITLQTFFWLMYLQKRLRQARLSNIIKLKK